LIADNNVYVEFNSSSCTIKDQTSHSILLQGTKHDGLYIVSSVSPKAFLCAKDSLQLWHQRLCYASSSVLQHLVSAKHLSCNKNNMKNYDSCCLAKSHKLPFPVSKTKASKPLEFVHCDVWGPALVTSHYGLRYYVIFTDQFSHFNWIYCIANKSDVFVVFVQFKALFKNLLSTTIKIV
jgi:GAG-pre-integrase domain